MPYNPCMAPYTGARCCRIPEPDFAVSSSQKQAVRAFKTLCCIIVQLASIGVHYVKQQRLRCYFGKKDTLENGKESGKQKLATCMSRTLSAA